MSARREARASRAVGTTGDRLPAPFLIGACIEVWADRNAKPDPYRSEDLGWTAQWWSARRRFSDARTMWLDVSGVTATADRCEIFPASQGRPWSADFLIEEGRAEEVAARFALASCAPVDIPALRRQAARLLTGEAVR